MNVLTNEKGSFWQTDQSHKILLCCVWYMSYLTKQAPEFHWLAARGYIRVNGSILGPLGMTIKPIIYAEILSLHFVLTVSSLVSPFQKSRGFKGGQIVANSQCLLRMSAGLYFPSFQWN